METGNQLIRVQAMLREMTVPFSRQGAVQSLVLSGFSYSLSKNFQAWAILLQIVTSLKGKIKAPYALPPTESTSS